MRDIAKNIHTEKQSDICRYKETERAGRRKREKEVEKENYVLYKKIKRER